MKKKAEAKKKKQGWRAQNATKTSAKSSWRQSNNLFFVGEKY